MLRVGELTLVLAPLAGLVVLYAMVYRGVRVSRRTLALAVLGVLGFGWYLTWLGTSEGLDRGERYVPAQVRDGAIIPGHGA